MIRTDEQNGIRYVSVTSAMKLVKTILGEPEDYYGPLGRIHAMEGEGCHRICLDWLAAKHAFIENWHIPQKPEAHPSQDRWNLVIEMALNSFQEFVKMYEVIPIGIEQEAFSKAYGLVGHIDLPAFFKIPGRKQMKGPIDLKFTSSVLESHHLQVRCYSKLDGMKDSNLGGIFNCSRETGAWKFIPVELTKNLDDVAAVSYAAKLWAWNEQKKN